MQNHWIHQKPSWLEQHRPENLETRLRELRRIIQARRQPNSLPRLLLCRPRGGLNDSLCQIQKALIYSLRFGRQLIIDTSSSGLRDNFDTYFQTVHHFPSVHTRLTAETLQLLNAQSCHPHEFQGRLDNYTLSFQADICNFVDSQSQVRPCIDADDHPESVLLHDQCGGGRGIQALAYFKLTESVANRITNRITKLPYGYTAIHIRYADVPFDIEPFLRVVKTKLDTRNALLCTDSQYVLKTAARILDTTNLLTVSELIDSNGEPLHDNPNYTTPETNCDALTDLFALANANQILLPSGADVYPSGFTMLAADLSKRNDLIRQLLGAANNKRLTAWRRHNQAKSHPSS